MSICGHVLVRCTIMSRFHHSIRRRRTDDNKTYRICMGCMNDKNLNSGGDHHVENAGPEI